jgi:hypothetical protein
MERMGGKENLVTQLKKNDRVLTMDEDIKLNSVYKDVFELAMKLSESYPQQVVASTYMAIAMRLYRTALAEEEYGRLMRFILDTPVEPFNTPTYH